MLLSYQVRSLIVSLVCGYCPFMCGAPGTWQSHTIPTGTLCIRRSAPHGTVHISSFRYKTCKTNRLYVLCYTVSSISCQVDSLHHSHRFDTYRVVVRVVCLNVVTEHYDCCFVDTGWNGDRICFCTAPIYSAMRCICLVFCATFLPVWFCDDNGLRVSQWCLCSNDACVDIW